MTEETIKKVWKVLLSAIPGTILVMTVTYFSNFFGTSFLKILVQSIKSQAHAELYANTLLLLTFLLILSFVIISVMAFWIFKYPKFPKKIEIVSTHDIAKENQLANKKKPRVIQLGEPEKW